MRSGKKDREGDGEGCGAMCAGNNAESWSSNCIG